MSMLLNVTSCPFIYGFHTKPAYKGIPKGPEYLFIYLIRFLFNTGRAGYLPHMFMTRIDAKKLKLCM
jgi:hypothetical protein